MTLIILIFIPFITSFILSFFGRLIGSKGSSFFSCFGLFITASSSILFYFICTCNGLFYFMPLGQILTLLNIELFWIFICDMCAITMFVVVSNVSFIVHIFSYGYMHSDPHIQRFMSYISLFTFFMLILVSSDNFFQFFPGWEGAGLCSYLSIGFWYTRVLAISSALKALIVNRISDFAVLVVIVLSFWIISSLDFQIIFSLLPWFHSTNLFIFNQNFSLNIITVLCIFLLFGAMGKSAQILLHIWLPDAMEGPTPVSALIHAATMVTAGIFAIVKISTIFEFSNLIQISMLLVGGTTAFMSGTIGIIQFDIKKVIAYSTCSQLGYMLLACGLSNYMVSFFHLVNHAFFKAMLFLCAGCIIHSVSNEQDIRKFGGFSKLLPSVCILMLIGSLALSGFIFLTGFYSKDFIIEQIFFLTKTYSTNFLNSLIITLIILATLLTTLYSLRLFTSIFIELISIDSSIFYSISEAINFLIVPLIILILGSIFIGFFIRDIFIGVGSDLMQNQIFLLPQNQFLFETDLSGFIVRFSMFVVFISVPILFYNFINFLYNFFSNFRKNYSLYYKINLIYFEIFKFLSFKWGFDIFYNKFINSFFFILIYSSIYELFEKYFLEKIFGQVSIVYISTITVRNLTLVWQSGSLIFYSISFMIFISFIILIS